MYNKETVFSKELDCLSCKCFDCLMWHKPGCVGNEWDSICERCYAMKDEKQITTKCIYYEKINKKNSPTVKKIL
jgi:hypothetical protein